MGFDQYHEPPEELSQESGIDLEFLLRRRPVWRNILKNILFKKGELIELAEKAEETIPED